MTATFESVSETLNEHLSYVISAGLILTFAIKLLVISGNSQITAFAILSETGSFEVLLGLLLTATPALVMIGTYVALIRLTSSQFWTRVSWGSRITYTFLTLIPAITLVPWVITVFMLGVLVFSWVVGWLRRRGQGTASDPPDTSLYGPLFFAGFALYLAVFSSAIWLPPERLELDSGDDLVGYVLSSGGGEIVVLEESSRTVLRLGDSEILARRYCALSGQSYEQSLAVRFEWIPLPLISEIPNPEYEPCSDDR